MRRNSFLSSTVVLAAVAANTFSSAAPANDDTGGASPPGEPSIATLTCADGRLGACSTGTELIVEGTELQAVRRVVFLGGKGRRDDRSTHPTVTTDDKVTVVVPPNAHTGPLMLDGGSRPVRTPRIKVTSAAVLSGGSTISTTAAPDSGAEIFPIAGPHSYGTSVNRFGGGRGHQGQDVFAKCGTPLVAVGDSKVLKVAFQSRAGNYVVLQRADGTSNAYMHMRDPAAVAQDATVTAGQVVGAVGETGRAEGCHLHFELWTAPGWSKGGRAVDPLASLRGWDASPR